MSQGFQSKDSGRPGINWYNFQISTSNKRERGVEFLGHVAFYHRFIKDFLKISWPLNQLLLKDPNFDFSIDFLNAFSI